jgi:hypothetical protein
MSFDGFRRNHLHSDMNLEAELPPKLAALAEQLGDDARRLERRYPAREIHQLGRLQAAIAQSLIGHLTRRQGDAADLVCQPADQAKTVAGRVISSKAIWRSSIAASAVAATVVFALAAWQAAFHREPDRRAAPVAMPAFADQVAQAGERADATAPTAAEIRPVDNLLRGLSAAEQEAVLDLFEDGAEQSASLSI